MRWGVFQGIRGAATDTRAPCFLRVKGRDERGRVSDARCNCQSCNKTFNAFGSNKRIVRRVLHWAVSRGHYAVTGQRDPLIGCPNHHGRSLTSISPSTAPPYALSIPLADCFYPCSRGTCQGEVMGRQVELLPRPGNVSRFLQTFGDAYESIN